jgi:hypothetical protein
VVDNLRETLDALGENPTEDELQQAGPIKILSDDD